MLRPVHTTRTYGPYVRACFFAPVRTRTYGPLKRPIRTGSVYGTPVYVARNVISIKLIFSMTTFLINDFLSTKKCKYAGYSRHLD